MSLRELQYHIEQYALEKGRELAGTGKGMPIIRHGEVRNKCWNCGNHPRELRCKGEKGYYRCEFCGARGLHK